MAMWVFTALARSSEGAVNQGKAWASCATGGKQTECSLVPPPPQFPGLAELLQHPHTSKARCCGMQCRGVISGCEEPGESNFAKLSHPSGAVACF